jgi:hypothetical protein
MNYQDLVVMPKHEILEAVDSASKNELVVEDFVSYTNLGSLVKILTEESVSLVNIYMDNYLSIGHGHSVFNVTIGVKGYGTIRIKSEWCVWHAPRVDDFVEGLLAPLQGIKSQVSFNDEAWGDDAQFIEKIISAAKAANAGQFVYEGSGYSVLKGEATATAIANHLA